MSMSVETAADACAFRLKRSLTLDPTGLASSGVELRLRSSCGCPGAEASAVAGGGCACRTAGSPSPTPFVAAAAANHDVVSAFQTAHDLPCSPGSVFRNQDTIIETSSSEDPCSSALTPAPQRLSGALSTPAVGGALCAAEQVPSQPSYQRQSSACLGALGSCPAHGVKAVCGKRNKMEDMYAVQPNFFDIPLSPTGDDLQHDKLPIRIAVQLEAADHSPTCSAPLSPNGTQSGAPDADHSVNSCGTASDTAAVCDTLHFFGVYDGHGGCQAAEHCARRLHHHLSRSLAAACGCLVTDGNQLYLQAPEADSSQVDWSMSSSIMQSVSKFACLPNSDHDAVTSPQAPHLPLQQLAAHRLLAKASVDSDTSSSSTPEEHVLYPLPENDTMFDNDSNGSSGSDRSDGVSVTAMLEEALKEAFVKTDAEFANDGCAAMVGSTALVALVGTRKVWLANCGDSRAVLCRGGKAIQLTDDHKPEREDEAERVEKAGGQVLFWNGHRVMGVLAMSRAIGDHGLRPYIIPEPEVSVVCRTDEDDFLLLASDGLWDVMSNQEATNLCCRCIKRAREKGASRNAAVRVAASVLTKAAIDRGSKDNVTVVIVDLKTERPGAATSSQVAAGDAASVGADASVAGAPQVAAGGACAGGDARVQRSVPC
ncbi:putative protein phosphatase 2C 8 [Tetrabaena socialis]|uniref:protein-serine/threonine phosphatase n=1 Tax=Tetrabaena socialis TaxID=47790 RepID=A0A2J7ZUX7_9CHLO|nr:putative protein phosphatase 2C 8 [Tetrabaena socialis]|eukprot:PNH04050.1 putative protein phosphatase 2C 8 [Tetrabaena socialis]